MSDIRKTSLLNGLIWLRKDGHKHYWSIAKDAGWEEIPKRLYMMLATLEAAKQDD